VKLSHDNFGGYSAFFRGIPKLMRPLAMHQEHGFSAFSPVSSAVTAKMPQVCLLQLPHSDVI
jgi:hypothetical protein